MTPPFTLPCLLLGLLAACSFPPSVSEPNGDRFGHTYPQICAESPGTDIPVSELAEAVIEQRAARPGVPQPLRLGGRILAFYDPEFDKVFFNPVMRATPWERNDAIKYARCRGVVYKAGGSWVTPQEVPTDRLNGQIRSGY